MKQVIVPLQTDNKRAVLFHTGRRAVITTENAAEKSPEARDVAGNALVFIPIL